MRFGDCVFLFGGTLFARIYNFFLYREGLEGIDPLNGPEGGRGISRLYGTVKSAWVPGRYRGISRVWVGVRCGMFRSTGGIELNGMCRK